MTNKEAKELLKVLKQHLFISPVVIGEKTTYEIKTIALKSNSHICKKDFKIISDWLMDGENE